MYLNTIDGKSCQNIDVEINQPVKTGLQLRHRSNVPIGLFGTPWNMVATSRSDYILVQLSTLLDVHAMGS